MNFIAKLGITYFILLIAIDSTFSINFSWDPRFENDWTGVCPDGRSQSPIAIPGTCQRTFTNYMNLHFINLHLPIKNVKVTNTVRSTNFEWDSSEVERSVVLKTSGNVHPFKRDTPYILRNFHVHHGINGHSGTLHALNGSFYAMEMHLLYTLEEFDGNLSGAFSSLGDSLQLVVLWKLSNVQNRAWTQLNNLMFSKKLKELETITSDLSIRLTDFIPKSSNFVLYHGSLVSTDCPEVVTWIVFDDVMEFDTEDLGMRHWTYMSDGKEVTLNRNIRRIQSLNDRPVYQGRREEVKFFKN